MIWKVVFLVLVSFTLVCSLVAGIRESIYVPKTEDQYIQAEYECLE